MHERFITLTDCLYQKFGFTRGIKHDFPFINIRKVPKEVLKTEGEARGFQPARGTLRMLMNDKIMFDRYHCINKLYVTLRSQLPGKPVPDGLQERHSLGPLGLCVRGVCIRSRFLKCHACTYAF